MSLSPSLTTRLEYQHNSIGDLIEGLSDEQIRRQVIPGKWSIFENIVHLATYQHAFLDRLDKILSEENPQFSRYNAESDPLFYDNCLRPTREIMLDLGTTRGKLINEILSMEPQKFHRTGGHPVFGNLNITQWLHFFLLHEAHHLFTMFKLIPELRKEARRPA
jgi:hypothetical protein